MDGISEDTNNSIDGDSKESNTQSTSLRHSTLKSRQKLQISDVDHEDQNHVKK